MRGSLEAAASEKLEPHDVTGPAAAQRAALLRPGPAYFSALALIIWLIATWDNTSRANFPIVLGAEALVLTFSFYVLQLHELTVLGQAYAVVANLAWLGNFASELGSAPPWWNPAALIVTTLVLGHVWNSSKFKVQGSRFKVLGDQRSGFGLVCQAIYALGIVAVLYCWLHPKFKVQPQVWLALTSGLAICVTAYGVLTRFWFLAASGQLFILASCIEFGLQLAQGRPEWYLPLAPIAALALLSGATVKWFQRSAELRFGANVSASTHRAEIEFGAPLLEAARVYRWAALVLAIWWVCEYISEPNRVWVLALLSAATFAWGGLRRNGEALLFSAAFAVPALFLFWAPLMDSPHLYWGHLLLVCALLAQQQSARRFPEHFALNSEAHAALIFIGGFSLWRFLTVWVSEQASGFYLTASWSVLALVLFAIGIALRERIYRWLGLGILACALGRVVVFDVWRLEMIYRVLSFMALGIVLLVLGFIYNKYQEKIRAWL
ncbi:MAG: hypothetical protein C5B50_20045 [Verrucomicrobia bacterium]|nr:MAG: hypothetical protein C5B50_20045 [Verrucomicrobiota bacterium]